MIVYCSHLDKQVSYSEQGHRRIRKWTLCEHLKQVEKIPAERTQFLLVYILPDGFWKSTWKFQNI